MLSVNGCVAVDSMALDSGTLNLSDKSEIIGQFTASESTGIISNGDLTISDNLLLSGANTSLEVNGSLFHRAGYIKAARISINGDYFGYSEDEQGSKLPGGYLVFETEYNSNAYTGDYTIYGDCYLYNDIYSEFTEAENGSKVYNALKKGQLTIGGDLVNLNTKPVGCSMELYFGASSSTPYEAKPQKVISTQNGGFVLMRYYGSNNSIDVSEAGNIDITAWNFVSLTVGEFRGNITFADENKSGIVCLDGSMTVEGNIDTGHLLVQGNLTHKSGGIRAENFNISGDYYGYTEDAQGNKLPGGYLICETEYSYNNGGSISEYTISGDCYLYNDIYSEFTEDENGGREYNALKKGWLIIGGDLVNLGENTVGCSMELFFGTSNSYPPQPQDEPNRIISTQNGGFGQIRLSQAYSVDISKAGNTSFVIIGDVGFVGGSVSTDIVGISGMGYFPRVTFRADTAFDGSISDLDMLTVEGTLDLSGDISNSSSVEIQGDFLHTSGTVQVDYINITGNCIGYSETNGAKQPGGYFLLDRCGNININGNLLLNNQYYSEELSQSADNLTRKKLYVGGDLINYAESAAIIPVNLIFDGSATQNMISSNGTFILRYVTVTSPCLDLSQAEADITLDSNNYEKIYGADGSVDRVIPRKAWVADRNIVFDKGIGVEYLVRLSDNLLNDDSLIMKFAVNGRQTTIPISKALTKEWNGLTVYSFTCYVAAAEMTDVITAQIVSDLFVGKEYRNCVYNLCEYYLYSDKCEEMKPAVIAMLNYGTQAQLYFEHNMSELANSVLYGAESETAHIDTETLLPYKYSITDNDSEIRFIGYAISLRDTMTAKLYFSSKEFSVSDFSVMCGDNAIDPARLSVGKDEKGTFLAVSAVAPGEFDKAFTVTVGGITISNLSIYSYLLQSIELEHAELSGIVDTLYAFNEAVGGLSA